MAWRTLEPLSDFYVELRSQLIRPEHVADIFKQATLSEFQDLFVTT